MLWCRALPGSSSLPGCDTVCCPSQFPQSLFCKASAFLTSSSAPRAYPIPGASSLPEEDAQAVMPSHQIPANPASTESEPSGRTPTAARHRRLHDSTLTCGGEMSSTRLKQDTHIDIRYAHQGLSLLQSALDSLQQHPVFARQLYVHAMVYLLQGLPPRQSLSELEVMSLQSAIPDMTRPCESADQCSVDTSDASSQETPPSLLRRSFSTVVAFLIVLIRLLTPYIRALISAVAVYDRQYGLRVRVMDLTSALVQMAWNNVDLTFLIWSVSEVARGVGEGWRRGSEGRETEIEQRMRRADEVRERNRTA